MYGLPEYFRERIKPARLVANPGCYPTSAILALAPLLQAGLIEASDLIVDSKSGVSGAGRTPKLNARSGVPDESFSAYGVGKHRHMPRDRSDSRSHHGAVGRGDFHAAFDPDGSRNSDHRVLAADSPLEGRRRAGMSARTLRPRAVGSSARLAAQATKDVAGTNYCHVTARVVERASGDGQLHR